MIDIMNKNKKKSENKIKSNKKLHSTFSKIFDILIVFDGRFICNQTNGHKFKPLRA